MSGLIAAGAVAVSSLLLSGGGEGGSATASAAGSSAQQPQPGPGQIINRHGDVEDEANLRVGDWARRWEKKQTGWHKDAVHPHLASFVERWDSAARATAVRDGKADASTAPTVLVPLCGKSVDLLWLYQRGFRVIGIEFVPQAILEFFLETPTFPNWRCETLSPADGKDAGRSPIRRYVAGEGDRLQILQADILSPQLDRDFLRRHCGVTGGDGGVDAIWDRASLVAMNPHTRRSYAASLRRMGKAKGLQQLLNIFHYDQSLMAGPPFSVSEEFVRETLYPSSEGTKVERLVEEDFPLPLVAKNKSITLLLNHDN